MERYENPYFEKIDLQFWHDLIESHGKIITLKRGEYICRKGKPTNIFGYVKSGYLIYKIASPYQPASIGGFVFEGSLYGDYPTCMTNSPAMYDIFAGKKTEIWAMDATCLPALYAKDFDACQHGRFFMEALYNSLVQSHCAIYALDPTQRYLNLIRQYPQIEQDVPQKEIAEYIRIYPTSLSRIKKKLLGR